ncbi:MAG: hypothetical protein IGQ88_11875 [Gloeomargaritaceae cyanobacterium C42_A2020_066]|nr:hypothetical protein [Gloeomargaritaceae cyanobacterium C42_A2020_066]
MVVTPDLNAIIGYANDRIAQVLAMPGLVVISQTAAVGNVITDLGFASLGK